MHTGIRIRPYTEVWGPTDWWSPGTWTRRGCGPSWGRIWGAGASTETDHSEVYGNPTEAEKPRPREAGATVMETEWKGGLPLPVSYRLHLSGRKLLVHVPENIGEMMRTAIREAVLWREATRAVFQHYLELGYEVHGFERGGGLPAYVLRAPGKPDGGADGGDQA